MVNYSVHPLDGGFEREWRAGEHLRDLEIEISHVFERQANAVPFDLDPNPPHHVINVCRPPETFFGMRIGILVGEICYNLRSALDYLIFELAKLDSGSVQSGTQFPIMDAKKDFDRRGKTAFLKGINASHIAAIEGLQPYMGCNWTGSLRDFSNEDKHRQFVVGGGQTRITVWSALDTDLSKIRGMTYDRTAVHPATGANVPVKVHVAGTVAFDNGLPILETLQELKRNVADCLADFKPEF
ncbi:hypothetical protein [Telmatospirillum siberiense]|uniref:Uncharacterized protein n=1 Tax=Telmatospirillum siberiense TaxID=382514 RepID=A0A2N3PXI4_9PROT|nr:hypothetical protein [Telmatospirillum siberiense]PKU25116.1 hypothetical protein CWS72_07915 [Telmatospirillum siberiense]